ncbi:MAG: hypothetical protein AB7G23_19430 [Vicinamibacterales bacterium]
MTAHRARAPDHLLVGTGKNTQLELSGTSMAAAVSGSAALLQAGGDIYKLSKILGHSSVGVTEAHYAHLVRDDLLAASQPVRIPVAPRGEGKVVRMPRRGRRWSA